MTENSTLITSEDSDIEIEDLYGQNELSEDKTLCSIAKQVYKKTKFVFYLITVEPCILFYLFSYAIQSTLVTNMILEKACDVHFKFNKEICHNITAHPEEDKQIQTYTSQLSLYMSLIESLPVLLFILYMGSWSDKNGRKWALVIPMIGNTLSVVILMLNSLKWDLPPEFILFASVPKALTGGFISLLMICYAYISDISEKKDRTMRVALIDASFSIGPILGLSCGRAMYSTLGFVGAFSLSFLVTILCIIYIITIIKEPIVNNEQQELLEDQETPNHNRYYIMDALYMVFKPRENFVRVKLLILMSMLGLMVTVFQYGGLEYLFFKKKLNWNYSSYIDYVIFQTVTSSIVTVVFLPFLLYKLKIFDILIGLYGSISRISSLVTLAFSSSSFLMYLSVIVGSFGYMPIIIARAAISKLVDKDEIGKVFSLVACLEVIIPLGSQTVLTLIYNATLTVFPGVIFLLGAVIFFIVTLLFLSLYIMDKRTLEN